jgi:hypothetical protein
MLYTYNIWRRISAAGTAGAESTSVVVRIKVEKEIQISCELAGD